MRRPLHDGYELDDDRDRVDIDAVHAFLTASYWAEGRTLDTVRRLVRDAARVIAIYREDELIGFCRIASDDVTFAFLMDVFVLEEHRGTGLGVELVREAVENGPQAHLPWYLGTSDAHGLYERFGFGPPEVQKQMVRPGVRRR
jgi:GNAT superfamily N-acetyltransferase